MEAVNLLSNLEEIEIKNLLINACIEEEEFFNIDIIIDKIKKNEDLSINEKLFFSRYVRIQYGKPSNKIFMENIKKDFTFIQTINILKFIGIDKFKDSFEESILNNPSYRSYVFCKKNYDSAIHIIENNEYYDNAIKNDPFKNLITSSYREYPNGLKEGVLIKKEPYNSAFSINIFWIDGDFIYDVKENIAEGGIQKGAMFYFIDLPKNKTDMVNSILSYEYIKQNTNGTLITTDIYKFLAYQNANNYWNDQTINKLNISFIFQKYQIAKKENNKPLFIQKIESLINKTF